MPFLHKHKEKNEAIKSLRSKADAPTSKVTKEEEKKVEKVPKKIQKIVRVKKKKKKRGLFSTSLNERIFFIDNLATLLQAGMSLSSALGTLSKEGRTKMMRKGLMAVKHTVDNGGLLSEALSDHPEIFSDLYVSVVEVGEKGGTLAEVLERLAVTAKKAKALRSKMINAMIYPVIVIIAIIVVIIILMIYVFPSLLEIFKEVGAELPLQTKVMIFVVEFLQAYGTYVLGGFLAFISIIMFTSRIRSMKKIYHQTFMYVPLFGKVWKETVLTRVLGNLQMLMVSGVPIVQSFTISAKTAGNLVYQDTLVSMAHELEKGKPIADVLSKKPKLYPSLLTSMAKVGEETGKFDEILGKLEEYYGKRVDNVYSNMSSIIEPVLLLGVGVIVGFIAVAVIMPIYDLAQSF